MLQTSKNESKIGQNNPQNRQKLSFERSSVNRQRGVPEEILSDSGTEFASKAVLDFAYDNVLGVCSR